MRIAPFVIAAACSLGVAAAPAAAPAAPSTAASGPAAASAGRGGGAAAATAAAVTGGLPVIVLRPGAVHAHRVSKAPPTTAECERQFKIACYVPGQLQRAYDVGPLLRQGIDGRGQTIVIVDSFGSPTIKRDLAFFDATFHLPPPPSLEIIQPAGRVPPFDEGSSDMVGWAGETDLDVEYAHALAPGASILLVETPVSETEGTAGFPQIMTAEKYVIEHRLGGVISQSFSATEETFPSRAALQALRGAYTEAAAHGVTVLAASGDSGAADVGLDQQTFFPSPVTSWPDSDPLVTGVGGTQLHLDAAGRHVAPDSAWNDTSSAAANQFIFGDNGPNPLASGGGLSAVFARPRFQAGVADVAGGRRGVPDIAMSGACDGSVDVYQSFAGQPAGWFPTCGTSEATPLFAGIVALADQVAGHPLGPINPALYALWARHADGIVDVTSGDNTVSFTQRGTLRTVPGFPALGGYDLVSGVGTVNAATFVFELAAAAGH